MEAAMEVEDMVEEDMEAAVVEISAVPGSLYLDYMAWNHRSTPLNDEYSTLFSFLTDLSPLRCSASRRQRDILLWE